MEIIAPKEWHALLDVLEKERGIAIILGATDTGKSTLAKFLIFNLCKRGLKVALVDADIGQSFLGPPTTIGFAVFKSDPNWEVILSPPEIFFAPAYSPRSKTIVLMPFSDRMHAAEMPAGPAPTIATSNSSCMGQSPCPEPFMVFRSRSINTGSTFL